MLVYVFGLLDILAGVVLLLLKFKVFLLPMLALALLLAIKSLFYLGDFASWIDLMSVVMILLAIIGYYPLLNYAFVLWLVQKGIRSFF